MSEFAYRKLQYAVWDGTNLAEIQEFLPAAYVESDGTLWSPSFGGTEVAANHGDYVVGQPDGFWETLPDEATFLAKYTPIS